MGRSLSIGCRTAEDAPITSIEIMESYDTLGTHRSSIYFWGIPRLREVGLTRLSVSGETDPVWFNGWDEIFVLGRESELLRWNLRDIDCDPFTKARHVANLTVCYYLLGESGPAGAEPTFTIG